MPDNVEYHSESELRTLYSSSSNPPDFTLKELYEGFRATVQVRESGSAGSGFAVSLPSDISFVDGENTYILTAAHVVDGQNGAYIHLYSDKAKLPENYPVQVEIPGLNGLVTPAEVVAKNEKLDLALLRVPIAPAKLDVEPISVSQFADALPKEPVMTVSAKDDKQPRALLANALEVNKMGDLVNGSCNPFSPDLNGLNIDAQLEHGNSGGLVLNKKGEIVAMVNMSVPDHATCERLIEMSEEEQKGINRIPFNVTGRDIRRFLDDATKSARFQVRRK